VLANMVSNLTEGKEVHENLRRVAERFLDVTLNFMGIVPYDEWLKRAVRRQCAVVQAYPNSAAAQAFFQLAKKAEAWGSPKGARGNLEFFVERLIGRNNNLQAEGAPA
jgi:flagellar biosynthesis protein FlhG